MLLLAGLALTLGAISWWNRYESAHRVTEFWGAENARLIVEPGEVRVFSLEIDSESEEGMVASHLEVFPLQLHKDLTKAPGLAHLRYALTTDSNYDWEAKPSEPIAWKWAFRFEGKGKELMVLFTEDFAILGKLTNGDSAIAARSIAPMAETLRDYLLADQSSLPETSADDASNPAE